jgi:hypothetical protein
LKTFEPISASLCLLCDAKEEELKKTEMQDKKEPEAELPLESVESLRVPAVLPLPDSSDAPPDGGYGWVCVGCVFTINAFTWGVIASYGVYLAYYLANDVFPGATPLDYAYIGGLNFGISMIVASPVTYLTRIWGTHIPMFLGVAMMTGGFIAASFARSIWQLYLTQGLLVGMGVGFLFIPSVAVTSQWFDKKVSVAVYLNCCIPE